jgi:hypothetical protein
MAPGVGAERRGVRLWDGLEGLDQRFDIEAIDSPSGVTHLTFSRK